MNRWGRGAKGGGESIPLERPTLSYMGILVFTYYSKILHISGGWGGGGETVYMAPPLPLLDTKRSEGPTLPHIHKLSYFLFKLQSATPPHS